MATVYIHRKATNKEVFYIGISLNDDLKRPFSKHCRNDFWRKVVKKHGYEVEIFKCNIPYGCATTWEKILIAKYGRRDLMLGTLVNLTDGGEIPTNLNESSRNKMRFNKGRVMSLQMRLKLSRTNTKVNLNNINKNVRVGKYSKRKILKLDINDKVICEYSSLAEAYRDTGIRQGNIYSVCQGSRMIAGGYKWKYKNGEFK